MIEKNPEKVIEEIKGKDYSFLKKKLTETLIDKICPIGLEIKKLMNDKSYLEKILKDGREKAGSIAEHNLKEIKNIVGFL